MTETEKQHLSVERFTSQLWREKIDPEDHLRQILLEEEYGPAFDPDATCRMEIDDHPAFRLEVIIHADMMEKNREWVTFNNGCSYYPVHAVKEVIKDYDPEDWEYDEELEDALEFWLP